MTSANRSIFPLSSRKTDGLRAALVLPKLTGRKGNASVTKKKKDGQCQDLVFRVSKVYYDTKDKNYSIIIDENGIDNPNDPRELVILRISFSSRIAFFRDQEWLIQGVIALKRLTLWNEDYE
jgi:hypothetical protein